MKIEISILIICKNFSKVESVLNEILDLDHLNFEYEVLIGEGDNPSEQRNLLAQKAKGNWLLFLDDDSRPKKDILTVYKNLIDSSDVLIAGGPSLMENSQTSIGELSLLFFKSIWGIGPYISRYNSIGKTRISNERELILCNLLIKREYFLHQGGFSKDLYPNEENEFISRSENQNKIFYIPHAIVKRPCRDSWLNFSTQLKNYGRGRFKNLYMKNNFGDFIFLAPAFFSIYVLMIPYFLLNLQFALLIPMIMYLMIGFFTGVISSNQYVTTSFKLPWFFMLGHFSYGVGLWLGFVKFAILQRSLKLSEATFINVHRVK